MQQALKPASGAARAQVVAAELFGQFDVAMDETPSAFDMGFRGKDFRRLRVTLAHGTPPFGSRRGRSPRGGS
jgi:hypothetical protein